MSAPDSLKSRRLGLSNGDGSPSPSSPALEPSPQHSFQLDPSSPQDSTIWPGVQPLDHQDTPV